MSDFEVRITPPAWIIAASFFAFAIDLRSFRVPLKRAVQQVASPSMQKNFELGGRPAWEPLAEGTLKQKQGDRTLVETGLLQRVAGQLNLWTITSEDASIDSMPRATYGEFHQFGTSKMPARPWADLQEEDLVAIDDVFGLWFMERLARAGFTIESGAL